MNKNRTIKTNLFLFSLIGLLIPLLAQVSECATYDLKVDGSVTQGDVPHFWSECVGCGTAALVLRPEVTKAYRIGHDECGFKRVRGHGLFNDLANTNMTDLFHWNGNPSSTPTYTWTKFDGIMDSIKSAGMQPLVELSFMPKDLELNPKYSAGPPKNYDMWRNVIDSTVSHCVQRYGKEEVESWYWEVWNEPDYGSFWHGGSPEDYYRLYKYAVEGATRALPTIKIGGPSTTTAGPASGSPPKIAEFLKYCKANNLKVDFASCHQYGCNSQGTTADPRAIRRDNRERWDRIKASGLSNLKSFNTEWNSSYAGQGGNSHFPVCVSMDSHANAPFVAKTIKIILDDHTEGTCAPPDALSYWVLTDIFDEGYYIENHGKIPFGQVFGLMNYQGLRKATFNCYKMLHKMGNIRIALTGGAGAEKDGVDGFATLSASKDSLCVLVYNHYQLMETSGTDDVKLTIDKAPFAAGAALRIDHYRVDKDHSNPYDVWVKQGKPPKPTTSQWDELWAAQNLAEFEPQSTTTYQGGAITRSFPLHKQAVSLLVITSKTTAAGHPAQTAAPVPLIRRSGANVFVAAPPEHPVRLSLYGLHGRLIERRTVRGGQTIAVGKSLSSAGLCIVRGETEGKRFVQKVMIP